MCFITSGNLLSGSLQSQPKFHEKHYKVKMWNLVKLQHFFLRALLKEYVVQ